MIDIDAKVLQLAWPTNGSTKTSHRSKIPNIESEARRLRFQALGRACRSEGVQSLLLAHHADDQAETVLFRVLNGYTGAGLQGIKAKADIPECYGIWGVGRSGSPRLVEQGRGTIKSLKRVLVEDGGIELQRPLLDANKQDLYAHCVQHDVEWVEDQTNLDPALTPRNAIRSLLQTRRLPRALTTESLQRIAHSTAQREASHDQVVSRVFDASEIKLNIRSGQVTVKLPANVVNELRTHAGSELKTEEIQYRAALLVRRVTMLVSPLENISLQDVESAVELAFPMLFAGQESTRIDSPPQSNSAQFAKVVFSKNGQFEWFIRRSIPTSQDIKTSTMTLWAPTSRVNDNTSMTVSENASGSEARSVWSLFDGRFWIRVKGPVAEQEERGKIIVRFLRKEDLAALNKQIGTRKRQTWKRLQELLKIIAPGEARFTLPVIIESRYRDHGQNKTADKIIALPAIGWSDPEWKQTSDDQDCGMYDHWDIRYKKVDLCGENPGNHGFVV